MILAIVQFKIDIFSQAKNLFGSNINFIVTKKSIEELEKLAKKNRAMKKNAELALEIIKKNNVKEANIRAQNADECLEKLAAKGIIIATNDKKLRKKIKVFGNHIFLKKKRFIAFE
jgi:rRNA-processing protein FCF1